MLIYLNIHQHLLMNTESLTSFLKSEPVIVVNIFYAHGNY